MAKRRIYRDHRGRFAVQPRDKRGRFISRAAHAASLANAAKRTIVMKKKGKVKGRPAYTGGPLNRAFVADVDAFFDETVGKMDTIAALATERLAEAMQDRCPIDTGALHGSFEITGNPSAGGMVELSYGMPYANFVHDGTSRQAAQPWVDDTLREWPDIAEDAAREAGWSA